MFDSWCFCLPMPYCFSLALRFFCFVWLRFPLSLRLNPRPFVQSFFKMYASRQPHILVNNYLCALFLCSFLSLMVSFSSSIKRFLFGWKVRCTFSFQMMYVYLVPTGWILTSAYLRIQSTNQITSKSAMYTPHEHHPLPTITIIACHTTAKSSL